MHRLTRAKQASCAFLVFGVSACVDQAPTAPPGGAASGSTSTVQFASRGDSLAYALATAFSDGALRDQMLQALRGSPMNEHKLVLQDFVATYAARGIIGKAASNLGVSTDQLLRLVAGLPRLDLYLPFKQHRLTWEGTPDVVTAVVYDEQAPTINAVGVDGSVRILSVADGVPNVPLLIMHPEELKLRRENPQADVRGRVVQDATESPTASAHIPPGVAMNDVTAWLSANRPASDPARTSQSSVTLSIYINHFNIQIGDGWFGDSEMQFHSAALDGPLTGWSGVHSENPVVSGTCPLGSYYRNGVEEDHGYNGLFLLTSVEGITAGFDGPGGPPITNCNSDGAGISWYAVAIKEDDGFATGGNDDFGWRFYVKPSDLLYPAWATVPSSSEATSSVYVYSFFRNTWDSERSAYLRLQYYP